MTNPPQISSSILVQDRFSGALLNYRKLTIGAGNATHNFSTKVNRAEQTTAKFGKTTETSTKKTKTNTQTLFLAALAFEQFSQKIKQATDEMLNAFMELEQAMTRVRKVTGMSIEQIAFMREELIELSKHSIFTADELANIAATAGQLGIRGSENIGMFTSAVAKMGVATDLSFEEAALSTGKLTSVFDLQLEKAENLGSVINELSNTTAAFSSEIAIATRKLAPGAATMGVTADQAMAISAALIQLGQPAERAGTRMNTFFMQAASSVDKMASHMGIAASDMKRMMEEDMMNAFVFYLEGMSKVESKIDKVRMLNETFGKAASRPVLLLSENMDVLRSTMSTASNEWKNNISLNKEYGLVSESTWFKMKELENQMAAVSITMGESLAPATMKVIKLKIKLYETITKLPGPLRDFIGYGMAAISMFSGMVMPMIMIMSLRYSMAAATNTHTAAIQANTVAMSFNPIILVAVALIGLILILHKAGVGWDDVTNALKRFGAGVANVFIFAVNLIIKGINLILDGLTGLVNAFISTWNFLAEFNPGMDKKGKVSWEIDEIGYVSAQKGFSGTLTKDTMFLAHQGEDVEVTPPGKSPKKMGNGNIIYNQNISLRGGFDRKTQDEIQRSTADSLARSRRRGISG